MVLATARLVRLFTEDHLGRWYFRDPIEGWGDRHEMALIEQATRALEENPHEPADVLVGMLENYDEDRPWSWQKRVSEGAGCRWCVGFWLGGLVLTGDVLTRTRVFGWARPLFRFGLGVLSLNLVANWVGDRTGALN